jgi:hypothetical protein
MRSYFKCYRTTLFLPDISPVQYYVDPASAQFDLDHHPNSGLQLVEMKIHSKFDFVSAASASNLLGGNYVPTFTVFTRRPSEN